MKILVRTKPNSKVEKIEKTGENEFRVFIKEPPIKGRANQAIIKLLANYFKVTTRNLIIKVGHTSKNKIIEIK